MPWSGMEALLVLIFIKWEFISQSGGQQLISHIHKYIINDGKLQICYMRGGLQG